LLVIARDLHQRREAIRRRDEQGETLRSIGRN
jgi:hypothetical protein